MTALAIEVADAVIAACDAATWMPSGIHAERSYADWDEELQAMDVLQVDVVPVFDPGIELSSRRFVRHTLPIDIGLRKRFGQIANDTATGRIRLALIDEMTALVETVAEHFIVNRFDDQPAYVWKSTEIRALYIKQHLREMRQFTGIVRLTFQTGKQL